MEHAGIKHTVAVYAYIVRVHAINVELCVKDCSLYCVRRRHVLLPIILSALHSVSGTFLLINGV